MIWFFYLTYFWQAALCCLAKMVFVVCYLHVYCEFHRKSFCIHRVSHTDRCFESLFRDFRCSCITFAALNPLHFIAAERALCFIKVSIFHVLAFTLIFIIQSVHFFSMSFTKKLLRKLTLNETSHCDDQNFFFVIEKHVVFIASNFFKKNVANRKNFSEPIEKRINKYLDDWSVFTKQLDIEIDAVENMKNVKIAYKRFMRS